MATRINFVESRGDPKSDRGMMKIIRQEVDLMPADEYNRESLRRATIELGMVAENLKSRMRSNSKDPYDFTDLFETMFEPFVKVFKDHLGEKYTEMTTLPLADTTVVRILKTFAIMTTYPVSPSTYFARAAADPPEYVRLPEGLGCSKEEYDAFFKLMDEVDVPGANATSSRFTNPASWCATSKAP